MTTSEFALSCPVPLPPGDKVLLGHGSGGKLTAQLIRDLFVPVLGGAGPELSRLGDAAVVEVEGVRLAFTTDGFVVQPAFFPGSNIGELAINGTVNDLAMMGARPLFVSAGLILEEGLPMEQLGVIVASMADACERAGVRLVTGDTKVVERGSADALYITTSGIGVVPEDRRLSIAGARPGDKVIVSGTIGDHGIAILSQREGLEFGGAIESDTAPLHGLVSAMLSAGGEIHAMRDPTRGGLATTLNELAAATGLSVRLDEAAPELSQKQVY
jgi:hydrogenase expression/formation protein HypE